MSAAILDHRRNRTGISGSGWDYPTGVGRKYRDCNLDDSYAERSARVTRSGPPGYNLASTDDLTEQSHC
jgi:hypothetical protein